MSSYIIRLDDACPTMNHKNWERIENILDCYGVKPIVGIIPDNRDPDFNWKYNDNFWDRAVAWQKKGWILALHGLHHKYHNVPKKACFQRTHSTRSEYTGLSVEDQKKLIIDGLTILHNHGLLIRCFFAPWHNYDANTLLALQEITSEIKFISDGYAFAPYRKRDMVFIPSICDGPFRVPVPFGIFTYVFHPSVMNEKSFENLEYFFRKEYKNIISADLGLENVHNNQGLIGKALEHNIYLLRGVKRIIKF